jgi:hypothetical protein
VGHLAWNRQDERYSSPNPPDAQAVRHAPAHIPPEGRLSRPLRRRAFSRMLEDSLLGRLLKKVQMQGGSRSAE